MNAYFDNSSLTYALYSSRNILICGHDNDIQHCLRLFSVRNDWNSAIRESLVIFSMNWPIYQSI